jgi:lysophospholipase L1-like esterase
LGINDYGWGGADAQAAGRSKSIPTCLDLDTIPEAVAQAAPDDAVEKFAAAYFEMLQQLHTAAPEATFHCITLLPAYVRDQPDLQFCYQLRGITLDTYNDAIRAAVKLACDSGINARVADIYALHRAYESIDGTHPTRKGMRQLANMALVAMNKITVSAVNKENEIGRQAFRTCFKPTCIGCKFARDTGNTWSCVCEHGVQK